MDRKEVLKILEENEAYLKDGHFLLASGLHSDVFVDKAMLLTDPQVTEELCLEIAIYFSDRGVIDAVVSPAAGAISLGRETVRNLNFVFGAGAKSLYAEKTSENYVFRLPSRYPELISGKQVLIVEDVVTSGGSVGGVIQCVREAGGEVMGVANICNRSNGKVTAESLGVPCLWQLVEIEANAWTSDECPMCAKGIPINNQIGRGKDLKPLTV